MVNVKILSNGGLLHGAKFLAGSIAHRLRREEYCGQEYYRLLDRRLKPIE